jgi:hypothetical protein
MKILITIFLFLALISIASGQVVKQINIPHIKDGDTALLYKFQHERDNRLKLPHLISDENFFRFRFYTNGL